MQIKTFRAKTMQQALDLVRQELGPQATVLHTRELNAGLVKRMLLGRRYEIAAATTTTTTTEPAEPEVAPDVAEREAPPVALDFSAAYRDRYRTELRDAPGAQMAELQAMVEEFRHLPVNVSQAELPSELFDLFTDLIDADVDESTARDLLDRLRCDRPGEFDSPLAARARLTQLVAEELTTAGAIRCGAGSARVVALVGPTGVGKTTTIAKLAANFRLREGRRVGLITVDTYRIAAVEQLRTYADIIDLPMEVVSTPREMRTAVERMQGLDLVLIDTAGRSPRDDVKIQELRAMLGEARADEVHLVLSAVGSARSITAVTERFGPVGVTALLVTKLDEAAALGHLLSLAQNCELPFSYLTDGQNVPDDIRTAEARELAQRILARPEPCLAIDRG